MGVILKDIWGDYGPQLFSFQKFNKCQTMLMIFYYQFTEQKKHHGTLSAVSLFALHLIFFISFYVMRKVLFT